MKMQILKIHNLCRDIIRDYDNNSNILILSSLHLVNELPLNLQRYKNIVSLNLYKIYLNIFFSILIYVYKGFIKLFRKKKNFYFFIKNKSITHYNNFFVSHIVNLKELNTTKDFYFQKMPEILNKNSKTLILLINHRNIDIDLLKKTTFVKNYDVIILSNNLNFISKISIFIKSINVFLVLLIDLIIKKNSKDKRIMMLNSISYVFRETSQFTYRFFYQFNEVMKKYSPKNIFFTFEGYPWEKSIILTIKKNFPYSKSIAYQHSRTFPIHPSIKNENFFLFIPDYVLTSGKITYNNLKKYNQYKNIYNIGKNDYKNFKKNFNIFPSNLNNLSICIIPIGIEDEFIEMLKFSILLANENQNINFIFRNHPIIDVKKYKKKYKNIPQNLVFSKNSISEDISKSNMVIYRGSAAVIKFMLQGVIPIYFQKEKYLDLNIIESDYDWNIKIKDQIEFSEKINQFINNKEIYLMQNKAHNYALDYYSQFDKKAFKKFFLN